MKFSKSVIFCIWTVRILIIVSVGSLLFIPNIADYYSIIVHQGHNKTLIVMIALYVLVVPAIVTLGAMHLLLNNIGKDDIFIEKNVTYLNIITICLFVVGIICGIVAFSTSVFVFICVPFLFMGLVLLVLRNVFSKAVEIKCENDLTI